MFNNVRKSERGSANRLCAAVAAILGEEAKDARAGSHSPWQTFGWMPVGRRQRVFAFRAGPGAEQKATLRYGNGPATLAIGPRESTFAAQPSDDGGFDVRATHRRVWDFTRDGVLRSLEVSLNRLGLDHVDIAFVHDPDEHYDAQALPPDEGPASAGNDPLPEEHSARYHQHALYVLRSKKQREEAGLAW